MGFFREALDFAQWLDEKKADEKRRGDRRGWPWEPLAPCIRDPALMRARFSNRKRDVQQITISVSKHSQLFARTFATFHRAALALGV